MLRKLLAIAALSIIGAGTASADIIYSTRGNGITAADMNNWVVFSPYDPQNPSVLMPYVFDDGTFAGSGPHQVTGLNLGYDFDSLGVTANVDALVSFWDNYNYANTPINSGQIGSTMRLSFTAQPSSNADGTTFLLHETGLMALPGGGITIPDSTFGIMVQFVSAGTNIQMPGFSPIFHTVPVTVGSSSDPFAYDANGDEILQGLAAGDGREAYTWLVTDPQTGDILSPSANLYFELTGSQVPEPASLSLVALSGLAVLRRRR